MPPRRWGEGQAAAAGNGVQPGCLLHGLQRACAMHAPAQLPAQLRSCCRAAGPAPPPPPPPPPPHSTPRCFLNPRTGGGCPCPYLQRAHLRRDAGQWGHEVRGPPVTQQLGHPLLVDEGVELGGEGRAWGSGGRGAEKRAVGRHSPGGRTSVDITSCCQAQHIQLPLYGARCALHPPPFAPSSPGESPAAAACRRRRRHRGCRRCCCGGAIQAPRSAASACAHAADALQGWALQGEPHTNMSTALSAAYVAIGDRRRSELAKGRAPAPAQRGGHPRQPAWGCFARCALCNPTRAATDALFSQTAHRPAYGAPAAIGAKGLGKGSQPSRQRGSSGACVHNRRHDGGAPKRYASLRGGAAPLPSAGQGFALASFAAPFCASLAAQTPPHPAFVDCSERLHGAAGRPGPPPAGKSERRRRRQLPRRRPTCGRRGTHVANHPPLMIPPLAAAAGLPAAAAGGRLPPAGVPAG